MQNKIVEYKDLQTSLDLFIKNLKDQGINYDVLKEEREKEIDSLDISDEKKADAKVASTGIHKKAVKNSIKSMVVEYLGVQIKGSQIKIEKTFDWITSVLDDITKEYGEYVSFNNEDKFSISLEVLGYVHAAVSTYTTMNYDEKEQKLIAEKAKQTLKENRAFGRETKQIDSLGEA